jgi:hypothetical protein
VLLKTKEKEHEKEDKGTKIGTIRKKTIRKNMNKSNEEGGGMKIKQR